MSHPLGEKTALMCNAFVPKEHVIIRTFEHSQRENRERINFITVYTLSFIQQWVVSTIRCFLQTTESLDTEE